MVGYIRPPGGGGLGSYSPNFPDLNWLDFDRISRQTGRLNADARFYRQENERMDHLADIEQETEKRATADDAASVEDTESFWSKIADGALSGLTRTVDVLSRFNYGSANVVLQSQKDNRSAYNENGLKNPFALLPDDWEEVKNLGESWTQGFTGKKKTTFSDVIEFEEKVTGNEVPGWAQGTVGFAADVLLDPTTYIGIGLVKGAAKGAITGGKAVFEGAQGGTALANRVLRSPFPRSRNLPVGGPGGKGGKVINRETDELADEIVALEVKHPRLSDGVLVPLTKTEVKAALGVSPGIRQAGGRASDRVKQLTASMDVIQSIKKRVAQLPEQSAARNATVEALDKRILDLENGLGGTDEMKSYFTGVLQEELQAMRAAGRYPDLPNPKEVAEEFTDTITRGRLSRTARVMKNAEIAAKRFAKVAPKSKAGLRYAQQEKEAKAELEKLLGKWATSDTLADFKIDQVWKQADEVARKYDKNINQAREDQLLARLTDHDKQIKQAKSEGNKKLAAELQVSRDQTAKSLGYLYDNLADAKAEVFGNALARHLTNKNLASDPQYNALVTRISELEAKIAGPGGSRPEAFDLLGRETTGRDRGLGGSERDARTLSADELALRDAEKELANFISQSDKAVTFKDIVHKTLTSDEGPDFEEAVDALIPAKARKIEETFRRGLRKDRGKTSEELNKATEGFNDGNPRIEVDGEKLTYHEFARKAQKKGWVKPADRAEAESLTHKLGHKRKSQYKADPKKKQTRTTAEDLGTRVEPETVAFDRMFKSQHGMTREQFYDDWKDVQSYRNKPTITIGSKKLTREDYVTARDKRPVGRPADRRGSDKVMHKGAPITRSAFISRKLGSHEEFDNLLNTYAKRSPEQHRINLRKQFDEIVKAQNSEAFSLGKNLPVVKLTPDDHAKIQAQARKEAEQQVRSEIRAGKGTGTKKPRYNPIEITGKATRIENDGPEMMLARQKRADAEAKARDLAEEKLNAKYENRQPLIDEINELYRERDLARQAALKDLKEHRDLMNKRVDEQAILNVMQNTTGVDRTFLRIGFAGKSILDIPSPRALTAAVEKMSGLPLMKGAQHSWAKAFQASSGLEPELNLARVRMQSRTPELIHTHVKELKAKFGRYPPKARQQSLRLYQAGGAAAARNQLDSDTAEFFDDYVKYVDGTAKIGDEAIEYTDLNRWLPEKFQIQTLKHEKRLRVKTGQELLEHMPNLRETHDPLEAMWMMRIAAEQAMAAKAMQHTIRDTFGVKITPDNEDLADILIKQHGWEKSRDIPGDVIFDRQLKDQIDHLHDMLGSGKQTNYIVKQYDRVLNLWKGAVTVYNPGFYMRNGIGEFLMGAMDGLTNPRYYNNARRVILGFAKPDKASQEVHDALKSMEPWKNYKEYNPTPGGATVAKIGPKGNVKVSAEEAWILYSETGLRSGFVSSEYQTHVPAAGTIRATGPGQILTKTNEAVRNRAENFEDYFRMSHFLYRMEKSKLRDPLEAAEEAAGFVRKYHFDYSDFTQFEKMAMIRLFPFYKWTRKSVPLMASMLFTQPGRAMIYPKAMQNLSYGMGGTDPTQDDNGFNPNYDEVTPEWMRNLYAYPIGEDEQGEQTYFNVSTPQFDALKFMANPGQQALSMLSPAIKAPIETSSGTTVTGDFPVDDKSDYAWRQAPQSNYFKSLLDSLNAGPKDSSRDTIDTRTQSFFSGLGFYENTKDRQKGELLRLLDEQAKKKSSQ